MQELKSDLFEPGLRHMINIGLVAPLDIETGMMVVDGETLWFYDNTISDFAGNYTVLSDSFAMELSDWFTRSLG